MKQLERIQLVRDGLGAVLRHRRHMRSCIDVPKKNSGMMDKRHTVCWETTCRVRHTHPCTLSANRSSLTSRLNAQKVTDLKKTSQFDDVSYKRLGL